MQGDALSLVVSGSTAEDNSGARPNVAHLMLDIELRDFDWRKDRPNSVDDLLFLECAGEVLTSLFARAFQDHHVAYVRIARAAQAVGLTAGFYSDASALLQALARLRQAVVDTRSHDFLPFSVWLVSDENELEACRVVEALMALPDDEALLDQALATCTAWVDVFPSFVDVLFRAQASEEVLSWLRAAAATSGLHVDWNVGT